MVFFSPHSENLCAWRRRNKEINHCDSSRHRLKTNKFLKKTTLLSLIWLESFFMTFRQSWSWRVRESYMLSSSFGSANSDASIRIAAVLFGASYIEAPTYCSSTSPSGKGRGTWPNLRYACGVFKHIEIWIGWGKKVREGRMNRKMKEV